MSSDSVSTFIAVELAWKTGPIERVPLLGEWVSTSVAVELAWGHVSARNRFVIQLARLQSCRASLATYDALISGVGRRHRLDFKAVEIALAMVRRRLALRRSTNCLDFKAVELAWEHYICGYRNSRTEDISTLQPSSWPGNLVAHPSAPRNACLDFKAVELAWEQASQLVEFSKA